jgi:hypothetical protein
MFTFAATSGGMQCCQPRLRAGVRGSPTPRLCSSPAEASKTSARRNKRRSTSGATEVVPPAESPATSALDAADFDTVLQLELQENGEGRIFKLQSKARNPAGCAELLTSCRHATRHAGFRSTRRTKLIATIGPACESEEMLEIMARNGMVGTRLCRACPICRAHHVCRPATATGPPRPCRPPRRTSQG